MQNCWHWRPERCVNGTLEWDLISKCINLTINSLKILSIHFSYNKKIKNEENFIKIIKKNENVLKIWRIRNLTVPGKITIFKTLAISKVIHLALVTNVPQVIIDQLNKIKEFPTYYQDILIKWEKFFSSLPSLPSSVASQCL